MVTLLINFTYTLAEYEQKCSVEDLFIAVSAKKIPLLYIVKLQVVRFQIPNGTQSTAFYLYDTGNFEVGKNKVSITSITVYVLQNTYEPHWYCMYTKEQFLIVVLVQILVKKDRTLYSFSE